MHKAGFVNIIGSPNVGKSTLMNALVGERLSIITSKAQTTRHRIMGIVNGDDFQIVYSDTPGILKPAYKLQESMMNFVHGAVDDADVILYVTDTVEQSDRSDSVIERVNHSGIPTIVATCALTTRVIVTYLLKDSSFLGYRIIWWNGLFGFGMGFTVSWLYYLSGRWQKNSSVT
jgi:GTP-binding protein Era